MKRLLSLLIIINLWICVLAYPANGRIEKKEDRFTGNIEIGTHPSSWYQYYSVYDVKPGLMVNCIINVKEHRIAFGTLFISESKEWMYLRCHPVYLLVDGKPFRNIKTKHDGSVKKGYVLEFIRMDLDFDEIKTLSLANMVEVKICNTEWKMSDKNLEDIRTFIEMVEEGMSKRGK